MDLDRLFVLHYEQLVKFSRRMARSLGDAEEFVHEAYLRSRRRWSKSRRSRVRPEAYFVRSLKWAIADARRRAREMVPCVNCTSPAPSPEEIAVVRDSFACGLSPAERSLFAGLMAGQTMKTMSQELRISPGALAVRICRARRKLVRLLGPE